LKLIISITKSKQSIIIILNLPGSFRAPVKQIIDAGSFVSLVSNLLVLELSRRQKIIVESAKISFATSIYELFTVLKFKAHIANGYHF
jgi:hypothetical protein